MKNLVIIPARIGSKSIPKKNIKLLNNKPLIIYSIEYALKSNIVDKVIVSTDSDEIAAIAKKAGAEVPFIRPKNLALDNVQDFPVALHALEKIEDITNEKFDYIIWLRPTSPFRPEGLIEKGIEAMGKNPEATSLRAVTICSEHPYRQWIKEGDFINGIFNDDELYNWPRQKLPEVYYQTGDIEIVRRNTLLKGSITGNKVLPILINRDELLDIDDESDWERAKNYR